MDTCILITDTEVIASIVVLVASMFRGPGGSLYQLARIVFGFIAIITLSMVLLAFAISIGVTDLSPERTLCSSP